jgi:glycine cleavage system regulatory protein
MKKQASLVVSASFCADLSVWHSVLSDSLDAQLNITQSQLSEKGGSWHFQIVLQGEWHQVAKFELVLDGQRQRLAEPVLLHWMRAEVPALQQQYLPYQVELWSPQNPELVSVLSYFFDAKGVKIKELRVQTALQAQTGVPLHIVYLMVWIPLEANLPELRENFMVLCDEYHLDALFELARI